MICFKKCFVLIILIYLKADECILALSYFYDKKDHIKRVISKEHMSDLYLSL